MPLCITSIAAVLGESTLLAEQISILEDNLKENEKQEKRIAEICAKIDEHKEGFINSKTLLKTEPCFQKILLNQILYEISRNKNQKREAEKNLEKNIEEVIETLLRLDELNNKEEYEKQIEAYIQRL